MLQRDAGSGKDVLSVSLIRGQPWSLPGACVRCAVLTLPVPIRVHLRPRRPRALHHPGSLLNLPSACALPTSVTRRPGHCGNGVPTVGRCCQRRGPDPPGVVCLCARQTMLGTQTTLGTEGSWCDGARFPHGLWKLPLTAPRSVGREACAGMGTQKHKKLLCCARLGGDSFCFWLRSGWLTCGLTCGMLTPPHTQMAHHGTFF